MPKKPAYISKSKYLEGLRCPKLIWYQYNKKDFIPPFSSSTLEVFKQGNHVGDLARQLFPGGIRIERDKNPNETQRRSLSEVSKRVPLFEAGFTYKNCYALADILVPVGDNEWDLIEVKSSSAVKRDNYHDVAFQKYVYEGAGLKIKQCFLMHINKDYVKQGELDINALFAKVEITPEVLELVPEIERNVELLRQTISAAEPEVAIGSQCGNCLLKEHCWQDLPEDNVFLLRGNKKTAAALYAQGILQVKDIPIDCDLNEKQLIQVKSHKHNLPHVDKKTINSFIEKLHYPIYYLDFETIAPAVPIYDNTRPYEDLVVQFSLHVVNKEGEIPKHYSYLAKGDVDPRLEVLEQLKGLLKLEGTILAYYAEYEKRCLRFCVRAYPEYNEWFVGIKKRFEDLLEPFSSFAYYSPVQKGSASIKNVLPALTDINYKGLTIGNGELARYEYMRATYDKEVAEDDRQNVRASLEKYCELDTFAMVEVLNALKKEAA